MTIYYLKQDNTIWGCGDPECCGEYYEEIDEEFVDCAHEVEVDADHLHSCNGGGPVLEWRKASSLEETAYRNGKDNSYYDGYDSGWEFGIKQAEKHIIKLLEKLFEAAENAETRRLLWMGIAEIKKESQRDNETVVLLTEGENNETN